MRLADTWRAAARLLAVCLLVALPLIPASPPGAATVPDLYSAEVEVQGDELGAIFRAALAVVAVRATGTRAAADPELLAALGDPALLVQQYRSKGAGLWEVGFDAAALRAQLDAAGLPIWSEERPATLVWLAIDAGRGEREILGAAVEQTGGIPAVAIEPETSEFTTARETLAATAQARGLPLLLPLVDTEDLQTLTFADLWGDFTEPVLEASARYRADAVLIGRTQTLDPLAPRVRWTLLSADERWDWVGTLTDGPDVAADRFAERLATSADSLNVLRVEVSNIGSLDAYGQVYRYLQDLSAVEQCEVEEVAADRTIFRISVRGGPDQLLRVVALRRVLVPVDNFEAGTDLQFALVGGP